MNRLRSLDSNVFDNIFSNESKLTYQDEGLKWSDIEPYLKVLPLREQDILTLLIKYRKRQVDVARMLSLTQGAVSFRYKKAKRRLKYYMEMPKFDKKILRSDLLKIFNPVSVAIVMAMITTTCQTEVARIISRDLKIHMTQIMVRSKFLQCRDRLFKLQIKNPKYKAYYELLDSIHRNKVILHEVVLPHFAKSKKAVFSSFT